MDRKQQARNEIFWAASCLTEVEQTNGPTSEYDDRLARLRTAIQKYDEITTGVCSTCRGRGGKHSSLCGEQYGL